MITLNELLIVFGILYIVPIILSIIVIKCSKTTISHSGFYGLFVPIMNIIVFISIFASTICNSKNADKFLEWINKK